MRVFGVATAVCISMVFSSGCEEDLTFAECTDNQTPFLLSPERVDIEVGEEATFRRVARTFGECGLLPDSPELLWMLTQEGIATIVASDDSVATVRGVAPGITSVWAELVNDPRAVAVSDVFVR